LIAKAPPKVYKLASQKVVRVNVFENNVCVDLRMLHPNERDYTNKGFSMNFEEF
jgi:hypothetical protein